MIYRFTDRIIYHHSVNQHHWDGSIAPVSVDLSMRYGAAHAACCMHIHINNGRSEMANEYFWCRFSTKNKSEMKQCVQQRCADGDARISNLQSSISHTDYRHSMFDTNSKCIAIWLHRRNVVWRICIKRMCLCVCIYCTTQMKTTTKQSKEDEVEWRKISEKWKLCAMNVQLNYDRLNYLAPWK